MGDKIVHRTNKIKYIQGRNIINIYLLLNQFYWSFKKNSYQKKRRKKAFMIKSGYRHLVVNSSTKFQSDMQSLIFSLLSRLVLF